MLRSPSIQIQKTLLRTFSLSYKTDRVHCSLEMSSLVMKTYTDARSWRWQPFNKINTSKLYRYTSRIIVLTNCSLFQIYRRSIYFLNRGVKFSSFSTPGLKYYVQDSNAKSHIYYKEYHNGFNVWIKFLQLLYFYYNKEFYFYLAHSTYALKF